MSLSGCARDLAMGLAATVGGWIVTKTPSGQLVNFNWLGWLALAAGAVSVWLAHRIHVKDIATPADSSNGEAAPVDAEGLAVS